VSVSVQPPPPEPRRRTAVRRYLETRGVVGGFERPHATTRLRAADGTDLAGTYLPGPAAAPTAVLLVHGFAANRRKPAYASLADGLSLRFPVLSLDLRGHGGSAGACTLGDREAGDVAAGIDWLRRVGHGSVTIVGLSMGATAALHATSLGAPAEGLVLVSGPAWFRDPPDSDPLKRLHTIWTRPTARAGMRAVFGVRIAGPAAWRSPPHPVEMIGSITVPLLVIHGSDDAYFPPSDADDLHTAAGGPSTLWHEPAGFGHAEDGITPELIARLSGAIAAADRDGRFPVRDAFDGRPPR
jgi:uncharacterized protein